MAQVIQLDPQGFYIGVTEADECPIEKGVLLIPGGCIEADEPAHNRVTHSARWDGEGWVYEALPEPAPPPADPTPEEVLAAWRSTRFMPRPDFCISLKRAGLLTAPDAIAAAQGAIPLPLEEAILLLDEDQQDEARILWAGLVDVRRNHPLVALVAWSRNLTDEQVDAIFGWKV